MAEKGDSRNALIIALAIFVVLSLGLGVATYYGFAEQNKLRAEAKDAKDKETKAKQEADWERYQELLLKSYLGHALTAPDRERLTSLQAGSDNLGNDQPNKVDFTNLVNNLNERLKWDAAKKQPHETLLGKIDSLEAEKRGLEGALTKSNQNIARLKSDNDTNQKSSQAELDELQKSLQNTKKELADTVNSKSAEYQKVQKLLEDRDNQVEDLSQKLQQQQEVDKRTMNSKERKIKELQVNFDRVNAQINPPTEVDYAEAKGRIVNVDRQGLVYINLGSADFVKPLLTFSIFPPSRTGKAEGHRKGALEVVSVVGPHLSTGRLTDQADPNMAPVVIGDPIFNPAWNPTVRQHVAIAGLIDLTGTGRDDITEFMKNLQRQGVVVDAYLDLKSMTIQGPGINRSTGYLILGPDPEFDDSVVQKSDANTRKKDVLDKMNELKTMARQEGVPNIPLMRYLAMIGYRLPKTSGTNIHNYEFMGKGVQRKETAAPEGDDKKPVDK